MGQSRGVQEVSVFTGDLRVFGVQFLLRMVCSHGFLTDARTNQRKVSAVSPPFCFPRQRAHSVGRSAIKTLDWAT